MRGTPLETGKVYVPDLIDPRTASYDEWGNPLDAYGNIIGGDTEYDEYGNPLWDEEGNPVQYDEYGNAYYGGGEQEDPATLWEPTWDDESQAFYYTHRDTGETTWDIPESESAGAEMSEEEKAKAEKKRQRELERERERGQMREERKSAEHEATRRKSWAEREMDRLSKDDDAFKDRVHRASREAADAEAAANARAEQEEVEFEKEQGRKSLGRRPSLVRAASGLQDLRRLSTSGEALNAASASLKKLSSSGEFDAKSTLKAAGGAVRMLGRASASFSKAAADKLASDLAKQSSSIAAALGGEDDELDSDVPSRGSGGGSRRGSGLGGALRASFRKSAERGSRG